MEIIPKLLHYKYHLLILLILLIVLSFLTFLVPSLLTVVSYFWPLLVSTALFLLAVVVFGKTSASAGSSSDNNDPSSVARAGEGILNYVVAGPTEPDIEPVADAGGEVSKDE